MIHFFPYPALVGLLILAGILIRLRQQKHNFMCLCATALFGLYLLILIDAVLFPIPSGIVTGEIVTRRNIANTLARANLHPGVFGVHVTQRYILRQILENLLMTVPFGFGICFFSRLRARDFLWLAVAVGGATELSQLLVSIFIVGGPYRGVDINDVLLNATGVLLGYGLFRLFVRFFPKRIKWISPLRQ